MLVGDDALGAAVPQRVLDLLSGPFGIGVVVPMVVDQQRRVVEAGTFTGPSGAVLPFGTGIGAGAREIAFCRDVPGTGAPVVASRATASSVEDAVVRALERGRRVVFDPQWRVSVAEPAGAPPPGAALAGPRRWAQRDEACATRVLVVTSVLPGTDVRADGLKSLVEALAGCPGTRVTLACADGYGADRYSAHFQRQGVEVVTSPSDWLAWGADRRYHYSHVIVSDSGLATRLWPVVRSTQPQAMAVLYSEMLPVRSAQAVTGEWSDQPGAGTVAHLLQARLLEQLEGIEAAWCASSADARLLGGLVPSMRVTHVGPPVLRQVQAKGFADRHGAVFVATDNFDVAADSEASALYALEHLLPAWRRRDVSVEATVICDWPTPGLEHRAALVGAQIVPSRGDLAEVLSQARVLVLPAVHGTAAAGVVPAALAAGTPFVCTPQAVEGTFLDEIAGPSQLASPPGTVHKGWQLLNDEAAWSEAASYSASRWEELAEQRGAALESALAECGIEPPGAALWPEERWAPTPSRRPVQVAHRPASVANPPAIFVPDSLSEDERYELWHSRRGPGNAEVVAAIAAEANAGAFQPTISVLMPVCETEAWMLEAAVQSMVDQAYPNWELCMADDASTKRETLAAIDAMVARDPRVKLARLEERSGISGATNAALGLATGEFIAFLDHDDVLKPHALAQVVRWLNADPALDMLYSDEDKLTPAGRFTEARWKPDWSPNLLLCQNYICHFLVLRRSLVEQVGGLRTEFDGSQDYDLVLRVTDALGRTPERIAHIPDSLYSWRMHERSAASAGDHKPWAWLAAQRALGDWLARREDAGGVGGWTEEGAWFDVHRTRFRRMGEPKVSIVIPTRNGRHLLERCIDSVMGKSVYSNYELVVVDNQSDEPETLEYLATLPGKVVRYPHEFNYARQLNLAAAAVECDLLVFLNNDTVVMTTDWLDRLIEQAMRPEVGAVGPRLLLPNGDIQHEGILIGLWRGHANSVQWGNWWRMGDLARDVSAVTGACMATRPGVFWRLGGYDERLRVAYNDVDYCLRLHQAGYQVVYEPDAALFHAEGSTRGRVEDPHDAPLFNERWRPRSGCDPYYNPNMVRNRLLFKVEP